MRHRLDFLLITRALPLIADLIPRPIRRAVIARAAAEASYRWPQKDMGDLDPIDLMEVA